MMDPPQLSKEERAGALSLLLFLKEKRCEKINGWACINGTPQRAYILKEEASSPAVLTKSMFITSALATSEKRHVRCYNFLSVFVNTDMDENLLMMLKSKLAEMIVLNITPQIVQIHLSGQEGIARTICEAAKGALWTHGSKSALLQKITQGTQRIWVRCEPV